MKYDEVTVWQIFGIGHLVQSHLQSFQDGPCLNRPHAADSAAVQKAHDLSFR